MKLSKNLFKKNNLIFVFFLISFRALGAELCEAYLEGLPLYYWQQKEFVNFGDYLSVKIVERILDSPVVIYKKTKVPTRKLLALGSVLYFANTDDVLWGTGSNNKYPSKTDYNFTNLDVRAVRGPLTRAFLQDNFGIDCPEVYGDPALLFPFLFPEFKKSKNPKHPYIFIPHIYECSWFSKDEENHIVFPTDPWDKVIRQILDSEFVISSSLHGLIIAEAYGIPARYLRLSEKEPLFKYQDYYFGTNRPDFLFANSLEGALEMGGERSAQFDPERLYDSFPFEFWQGLSFQKPSFNLNGN